MIVCDCLLLFAVVIHCCVLCVVCVFDANVDVCSCLFLVVGARCVFVLLFVALVVVLLLLFLVCCVCVVFG